MGVVKGQNPEKPTPEQKPQGPLGGPESQKIHAPGAVADEDKTVIEKFAAQEKELVDRLNKTFEDRISGSKLGEVGTGEIRGEKMKKIQLIRDTHDRYKRMYLSQVGIDTSQRDALAERLLKQARLESESMEERVNLVMMMVVNDEKFTEADIARLKKLLSGIEKISAVDTRATELLERLRKGSELTDTDYNYIIGLIKPQDITNPALSAQGGFEATSAGLMLGMMKLRRPDQLVTFMEKFMASGKKEQTAKVIDGLLRVGTLNTAQGKKLFDLAFSKELIQESDYKSFVDLINRGVYQAEAEKVQKALQDEVARLRSRYANNDLDRIFGAPMLGVGMLLHSVFWLFTNVLASGGSLSALAHNPYVYAAIGEGALAVELTSGGMKRGAENWGIGSGWLSRLFERLGEKDKPLPPADKQAYQQLGEVLKDYPQLSDYLKQGGAATIMRLRSAKAKEGKKGGELAITIKELLDAEKDNKDQLQRLQELQHNFPEKLVAQVNLVAEAMVVLNFQQQDDYLAKATLIEESQGLVKPTAGLASAAPTQPTETPTGPEKNPKAVG